MFILYYQGLRDNTEKELLKLDFLNLSKNENIDFLYDIMEVMGSIKI